MTTVCERTGVPLSTRVAKLMNFLRPGEDPDAEFAAEVEETWLELHATMTDDGLCYWDVESIPIDVFRNVAWLVAIEMAPAWGATPIILQSLQAASIEDAVNLIRGRLRDHISKSQVSETLKIQVF